MASRAYRRMWVDVGGTHVDPGFVTGGGSPRGVAVSSSHVYWAGDVGTAIGRSNLNGSGVDKTFIPTGPGVCGLVG